MSFSNVELHILVGLANGKTLSEIGEELFMHQPALSRALRVAEIRAGLQLTEREGRRLRLTPAGAEIADAGRDVMQQLVDIDVLVERLRRGEAGTLRVIAAHTPANYVLPEVMTAFIAQYPLIEVSLRSAGMGELWDAFVNGRYDVAIVPQPVVPHDWAHDPLYEDSLVFFVGAASALAQRTEITCDELRRETLIGPFFQPHWAELWERLSSQGLAAARRVDFAAAEGVKRLVETGCGVGMLYRAAVWDELATGRLVALDCPELSTTLQYFLVRRRLQRPLPIVEEFASLLRGVLKRRLG